MRTARSLFARNVLITLGSILTATLLRSLIDLILEEAVNYGTFYLAVIVTSLHCGRRWGLACTALSGLAAAVVLPPYGKLLINEPNDFAGMVLFLIVSGLIVWLSHRTREAQLKAERAAEERHGLLVREQAARAEAERSNRAKDDILAAVSHELRTPLQSILGWSEILREGGLDAEEIRLATASIERSVRMQTQLINDLLDLSRIVMGKLRLDARPVSLQDIVEAAVQTVRPAALAKKVQIEMQCDGVGVVLGDSDRLQQVAWNLLTNAIKFTPAGGTVCAIISHRVNQVELLVKDTGDGIEPDFLPRIFERFEQADGKRRREGLGLGLAIVKELVELHGGVITAQSAGKGQGAQFHAIFPKHCPSALPLDATKPTSSDDSKQMRELAGKQILVIDDDADACQVLKTLLGQYGVDVLTAASVAHAKKLLAAYRPDAVTCDLDMPDEDGFDFVRELRGKEGTDESDLPVIALTGCAGDADRERVLQSGFQGHLVKPVPPRELAAALASVAGNPSRPR